MQVYDHYLRFTDERNKNQAVKKSCPRWHNCSMRINTEIQAVCSRFYSPKHCSMLPLRSLISLGNPLPLEQAEPWYQDILKKTQDPQLRVIPLSLCFDAFSQICYLGFSNTITYFSKEFYQEAAILLFFYKVPWHHPYCSVPMPPSKHHLLLQFPIIT